MDDNDGVQKQENTSKEEKKEITSESNNIENKLKNEIFYKNFKETQIKLKEIINKQKEEYLEMEKKYKEIILNKDNEIKLLQNKITNSSLLSNESEKLDNIELNKLSILLKDNIKNKIGGEMNNMIEELNVFFEKKMEIIKKCYQERLIKIIDENKKLKDEIIKNKYLSVNIIVSDNIKNEKIKELEEQIKELKNIIESKENIINVEKEKNNIINIEYTNLQKECKNLQTQYNQSVFAFKMKEDEIDTLIMILDAILNKKKGKYLHNLNRLSENIKQEVENIINSIKIFKSK